MLGNCVICRREVGADLEARTGMYQVVTKAYYLCFDCAVVKFANNHEKQLEGVYRAIYWLPEHWQKDGVARRTEIMRELRDRLIYHLSPTTKADEACGRMTYNDATMALCEREEGKIEEYRRRRLAEENPPVPPLEIPAC